MNIILLNTSILTNYGVYRYQKLTIDAAKILIKNCKGEIKSFIGHNATAVLLSDLLETPVAVNRGLFIHNNYDDIVIVFKLRSRIDEGQILSLTDIEKIGYDLGIIRKLKE